MSTVELLFAVAAAGGLGSILTILTKHWLSRKPEDANLALKSQEFYEGLLEEHRRDKKEIVESLNQLQEIDKKMIKGLESLVKKLTSKVNKLGSDLLSAEKIINIFKDNIAILEKQVLKKDGIIEKLTR